MRKAYALWECRKSTYPPAPSHEEGERTFHTQECFGKAVPFDWHAPPPTPSDGGGRGVGHLGISRARIRPDIMRTRGVAG